MMPASAFAPTFAAASMSLPLDSLATIFIFLIGLPAILLQTLPAEVRRTVLSERAPLVAFTIGPIFIATLAVVGGVILTYPRKPGGALVSEAGAEVLWLVVVFGLIGVCGLAALLLTERWRRKSVVRRLARAAARGIAVNGRPFEDALKALIELGTQSRSGEDKTLVVTALGELAARTQERPSYDGAQLEELIKGVEEVIVGGAYLGSGGNFKAGAELLEHVAWHGVERSDSDDLKLTVQLAGILGRAALRYEQPHEQIKFIEILAFAGESQSQDDAITSSPGSAPGSPPGPASADANAAAAGPDDGAPTLTDGLSLPSVGYAMWASQELFALGSEAIESGRILVAMTALSKLEQLVLLHSPVSGELANDFVGLVAHFCAQSRTGRDYGQDYLDPELFRDSLPVVIQQARTACIQGARFRTGDYLAALLADSPYK